MKTVSLLVVVSGLFALLQAPPGAASQRRLAPASSTASTAAVETADQARDPESAASCGSCHKAFYEEWQGAKHQTAWDDPLYQAKLKTKKRPKNCMGCHIPDRVLARIGRKPKTRKERLHEGVTCVACHEYEGAIHGPFGIETEAHKSVKDPRFSKPGSNELCASCHQTKIDVVLPVAKDFAASGLAAKGRSCVGCHMPEVTRPLAHDPDTGKPLGEKRKTRSHRVLGPDDPAFCAKAFAVRIAERDGKPVFRVENRAGHRVPGLLIRAFHFQLRQVDGAGKELAKQEFVVDSNAGLEVLGAREVPLEPAAGAVRLEVVVEHHFDGKRVAKILAKDLKL